MQTTRRVLDYGPRAALVECPDTADAMALAAALRADPVPGQQEVVPGARTVLIRVATPLTAMARTALASRAVDPVIMTGDTVEIEVRYDGPDLAEVAQQLSIEPAEVVARHTRDTWRVAFCGFAPGFAYLSRVGNARSGDLRVPRRPDPRTRVPAGAVGLADTWSGIYPRPGPGGWQLIGTTDAELWRIDRNPPALLSPGTTVRFVAVDA